MHDETSNRGLLFLGAGGHARSLFDLVATSLPPRRIAVIDPRYKHGDLDGDIEVFREEDLAFLSKNYPDALVAVGLSSGLKHRLSLCLKLSDLGFNLITVKHSTSIISTRTYLGSGVHVFARAYVGPGATIQDNVIVNTAAIVEHDVLIEAGAFIGPGAIVCGGARVTTGAIVGAGEVILPGVVFGKNREK